MGLCQPLAVVAFVGCAAVAVGAPSPARPEEACRLAAPAAPMTAAQATQRGLGQGYVTVQGLHRKDGCSQALRIDTADKRAEVPASGLASNSDPGSGAIGIQKGPPGTASLRWSPSVAPRLTGDDGSEEDHHVSGMTGSPDD